MSVYAITCNETGETYIGSTINIKTRMWQHRSISNTCKSKQIIERNNYTVHILEEGFDDVEYYMLEVERWYIETFPCVNKKIPGRTYKEFNDANKEQHKAYYQNNKERIKANNKAYKIAHKEQLAQKKKEWYLRKKQAKLIKI